MRKGSIVILSSLVTLAACAAADPSSEPLVRSGGGGTGNPDAPAGAATPAPGAGANGAPSTPGSTGTPSAGEPSGSAQAACDAGPEAKREGWSLAWCDEFNGTAIDASKWGFQIGDGGDLPAGPGWGNQELQYYTARTKNAHVEKGSLVLTAEKDGPHYGNGQGAVYDYSSARLTTKGKADFRYGRVEVRAKLPKGAGMWPAIWMLPTDTPYGGWPASGEIDIVESRGQDASKLWGTLHFGEQWPRNKFAGCIYSLPSGTFADDLHTFAVEWDAAGIKWFVDGTLYGAQGPAGSPSAGPTCMSSIVNPETNHKDGWYSSAGDAPAPFDRRFHVLLNLAVGGKFGGAAVGAGPESMTVDYVRVYQKM